MQEVLISRTDRGLTNQDQLIAVFNSLKIGHYRVIVKDARTRSLPQNAYYWGVIIPLVRQGLLDAGYDEVRTSIDAHEVLKHLHLRKRFVSKQTGDVIDIAGSSSKLTIHEFNNYIENICRWSAEFLGVVIPSPNQQMAQLGEYIDFLECEEVENEIEQDN